MKIILSFNPNLETYCTSANGLQPGSYQLVGQEIRCTESSVVNLEAIRSWNIITGKWQKNENPQFPHFSLTKTAELLSGKKQSPTEKRPERDSVFLELIAVGRGCFSPWLVTQTPAPALLSWVLSARLVNEHSSPAYVHSCPDVASGSAEAAGWWLAPFTL